MIDGSMFARFPGYLSKFLDIKFSEVPNGLSAFSKAMGFRWCFFWGDQFFLGEKYVEPVFFFADPQFLNGPKTPRQDMFVGSGLEGVLKILWN